MVKSWALSLTFCGLLLLEISARATHLAFHFLLLIFISLYFPKGQLPLPTTTQFHGPYIFQILVQGSAYCGLQASPGPACFCNAPFLKSYKTETAKKKMNYYQALLKNWPTCVFPSIAKPPSLPTMKVLTVAQLLCARGSLFSLPLVVGFSASWAARWIVIQVQNFSESLLP